MYINLKMASESSSSDGENAKEYGDVSDVTFVKIICNYPAVFLKSQTPETRKRKQTCLKAIREKFVGVSGKDLSEPQILKKINNMKSRMKAKTDVRKTGNKKIALKEWEELLFNALQGESNPTLQKIPGK